MIIHAIFRAIPLKETKRFFTFIAIIISMSVASAAPQLNNVASGNVSVTQSPNNTQINQTSKNAIINWNSFNIGPHEQTHFQQPAGGATLNRINPSMGVSKILGTLTANGKIILINPAGIYFGARAVVNVGSIIASTVDMSNENFLAGKYIFDRASGYAGSIVNKGMIKAAKYGLVALIGNNIENDGVIQARLGNIVLGSGDKFTIDLYGDQLINFSVGASTSIAGKIINTGKLLADGGMIFVSAKTAGHIIDNVIDMGGIVQARSVQQHNGQIILLANSGIHVTGKLIASGKSTGSHGGTIKIIGKSIDIGSTALLDASGDIGGGNIFIGRDDTAGLGTTHELTALYTTIANNSVIDASAITSGNGGNVVVWSDKNTNFAGNIVAKGGANSGNGGSVEVSSHDTLNFQGQVDLSAPQGTTGNLLLDPADLTIQTNGPSTAGVSGSIVTSNMNSSILTIATLQSLLANSNVLIQTGNSGSQPGDIYVNAPITWSNANTLTLSAYRNINVNSHISNYAGGSLVLNAGNTGNFVGTVNFSASGGVYMSGGGHVSIYYNGPQFNIPTNFSNSVNVSNNTSFSPIQQNVLTTAQNAAIISSIAQMTTNMQQNSLLFTEQNEENTHAKLEAKSEATVAVAPEAAPSVSPYLMETPETPATPTAAPVPVESETPAAPPATAPSIAPVTAPLEQVPAVETPTTPPRAPALIETKPSSPTTKNVTYENPLEKVTVPGQKPTVIKLNNQQINACKHGSCTMKEFSIE
jgi:filamentous hemagglutinin family protein